MNIQRYEFTNDYGCESVEEDDDGEYVDYSDHHEMVTELRKRIIHLEYELATMEDDYKNI